MQQHCVPCDQHWRVWISIGQGQPYDEDAQHGESILDFKITDISGEQYYFKEASLAFSRIDRTKRKEFDIWHPADCVGDVGAALGLVMIAVLKSACEKAYTKGNHILAHLGNDDGKRSSMIFFWKMTGTE